MGSFPTSSFGPLCSESPWYANVFMLMLRQGSVDNMLSLLNETDTRGFLKCIPYIADVFLYNSCCVRELEQFPIIKSSDIWSHMFECVLITSTQFLLKIDFNFFFAFISQCHSL